MHNVEISFVAFVHLRLFLAFSAFCPPTFSFSAQIYITIYIFTLQGLGIQLLCEKLFNITTH